MGDAAEGIFEEVAPLGAYVRFGFNRPPFKMGRMSSFLRHTPDYATGTGHLVEVMGVGRDGVVKFKLDKYEALKQWNRDDDVVLFIWNSATSEWTLARWGEVKSLVGKARKAGVLAFDDGNEYYPIDWSWFSSVLPYAA